MSPSFARALVLTLLAAPVDCGPALAESHPIRFSVLGGLVISELRDATDPSGVLQSMNGFGAGAAVAWPLSASIELELQLLYIQKGVSFGRLESTDPFGNSTGSFEALLVVDALEVPVLLRWAIPTSGRLHPVLLGGPFVSFEVSEQFKFTGSQESSLDSALLNGSDFGVVLGAGLEVDAGRGRWLLQGRYEAGIANVGQFYVSDDVHSGAWLIMTGYRF